MPQLKSQAMHWQHATPQNICIFNLAMHRKRFVHVCVCMCNTRVWFNFVWRMSILQMRIECLENCLNSMIKFKSFNSLFSRYPHAYFIGRKWDGEKTKHEFCSIPPFSTVDVNSSKWSEMARAYQDTKPWIYNLMCNFSQSIAHNV